MSTKNDDGDDSNCRWFSDLLGCTYHWAKCLPCIIISFTFQNDDDFILHMRKLEFRPNLFKYIQLEIVL